MSQITEFLESLLMIICIVPGVVCSFLLNFIIPSPVTEESAVRLSKIFWFIVVGALGFIFSVITAASLGLIIAAAFYKFNAM